MHLYVAARGNLDRLKRWENDLTGKYNPYLINAGRRTTDNKGWLVAPVWGMYQLAVRPIQLYEIIFPEHAKDAVLGMIQPYGGYGIKPLKTKILRGALSKMLGIDLEEIPEVKPEEGVVDQEGNFTPPRNFLIRDGVDVLGIGIKKDKVVEQTKVEDL